MSFLKKLSNIFSSPGGGDDRSYWIYTRCNRCGEKIRARVDLSNDLSLNYEGDQTTYFSRKVLIGEQRCFEKIEVLLTFDKDRKRINQEISGGQFISEEQFFEEDKTSE
jgi:hypothetical protein